MATNKITEAEKNQAIVTDNLNQVILAMVGDFVPRDPDGMPLARGGDLGTIHHPWDTLHVNKIFAQLLQSNGTELPQNPVVGDLFFLTAQDGVNAIGIYGCVVAGSWKVFADASVFIPSGNALPAAPNVGDMYILKTPAPATLHLCLTAGAWSDFPSEGALADYVKKTDLEGHEDDFYASEYDENILQAGVTDKRFGWALASGDGSAAPVQAQVYTSVAAAAAGARTLIIAKTQWETIPRAEDTPHHAVTSEDVSALVNAHSADPPDGENFPAFSNIGVPVSVGAGNGAYWYVPVTLAFTGSKAAILPPWNGHVWRLSAFEPSTLKMDIPASAIGNPPWVAPSGIVLTDATLSNADQILFATGAVADLGEVYEHHDQFHTGTTYLSGYRYVTASGGMIAGDVYISPPVGGNNPAAGTYTIYPADNDDKTLLKKILRAHKKVRYFVSDSRYIEFTPSGSPTELFGKLSGSIPDLVTAPDAYALIGAALTNQLAVSLEIESRIPAREQIVDAAYKDGVTNLAGGGGVGGKIWAYLTSVTNATWRRLLDVLKEDAISAAQRADYRAALATGRLQKSVAGSNNINLSTAEAAYDSVEFTGAKTGNIIVTLPTAPSGPRMLKNSSTGAYTLKAKVSGQADSTAVTLAAGNNLVLHDGAGLTLFTAGGGGAVSAPRTADYFAAAEVLLASADTEYTVATLNFTPSDAAKKVKLDFNGTGKGDWNNANDRPKITYKVYRGSTLIRTEDFDFYTHVATQTQRHQSVIFLVDSPAAANAQTYKVVAIRNSGNENAGVFNRSMILTEVS